MWWGYRVEITDIEFQELTNVCRQALRSQCVEAFRVIGGTLQHTLKFDDATTRKFLLDMEREKIPAQDNYEAWTRLLETQLQTAFPSIQLKYTSGALFVGKRIEHGWTLQKLTEWCNESQLRGAMRWLRMSDAMQKEREPTFHSQTY